MAASDLELSGTLAWARVQLGQTREGRALALRCAELSEQRGETVHGPQIGWCLSWLEEYESARALIERAARAHREAGAFGDLAYVLFHLAELEFRTGRLAMHLRSALEAFERLGAVPPREHLPQARRPSAPARNSRICSHGRVRSPSRGEELMAQHR